MIRGQLAAPEGFKHELCPWRESVSMQRSTHGHHDMLSEFYKKG